MKNARLLQNQTALITGASRGIGRAAALLLAEAGANVVLAARSAEPLQQLAGEIARQGGAAQAVPVDISREADVARLFAEGERTFGPVDILVNNASVIQPFGKVWETDPVHWWRLLEINLYGSYLCTRAAVPAMLRRQGGRVIFISSGVAVKNLTGTSAYNSSKAALERFCGTLAEELAGSGVVASALRPGKVNTAMQVEIRATDPVHFPRGDEWRTVHRRGELLPPELPAQAILWLASRFASDVNGQTFSMSDPDFRARVEKDLAP